MRAFVVLSIIAVASAGRLGYDYQLGVSGSAAGPILSAPTGLEIGLTGLGSISNYGIGGPDKSAFQQAGSSSSFAPVAVESGLNKEFYHYAAPDEEFYDCDAAQRALSSLKKNLRVVFIKAPENNGLADAALQLAKQAGNDRTAIYVLSKQPDISDLADQVQALKQSVNQKPEVRFIKYRTPEDAANAERTIQQQYDALGGSSRSSNEGFAPVLNYASAPQHAGYGAGSGSNSGAVGLPSNISPIIAVGSSVGRDYLPSNVYYK